MPPDATNSKKAIFSAKVTVKVTRSSNYVSIKRASVVEYACMPNLKSRSVSNGSF